MGDIRIGKVSKIDYQSGEIEVVYEDRDNQVTTGLPFLCNGEYSIPDDVEVGDMVAVAHLSNGSAAGIVLGTYFNEAKKAKGKGIFYKLLSKAKQAFIKHEDATGTLTIKANKIVLNCNSKDVDVENLLSRVEALERRMP